MQLIITDARLARSRVVNLTGILAAALTLMLTTLGLYHWVFLKGAQEGWPVVGTLVKLVTKEDFAQRDRFVRENLEVMARQLGELQAKLQQLESLGERVSGLAGLPLSAVKEIPAAGGPLVPCAVHRGTADRDVGFRGLGHAADDVAVGIGNQAF